MIIIIGAGLSGLLTAYRLKQEEIPFKVLEAKSEIGGRIKTKITSRNTPIEMGATWFGRQHQNLNKLLDELELEIFPQFQGDYYFYDDVGSVHHGKYQLPRQEASYRIGGGTASLVQRLYERIDSDNVITHAVVTHISSEGNDLIVKLKNGQAYKADQIILAVPPKIWVRQIKFSISLPEDLLLAAQKTQTWMEDSIKGALEFETPFWRQKNLPSTIMSAAGPFIECYDHTNYKENKFALCGFLKPGNEMFTPSEREGMVKSQLKRILGKEVLDAISYHEYNWSDDNFVKLPKGHSLQPHQNNGHPIFQESFLNGDIIISGSETASQFPGYMDGAVEAAETAFKKVLKIKHRASYQKLK